MLKKRIVSSLAVAGIVFSIIFIMPNWVYCLLVTTMVGISLSEFFELAGKKGIFIYKYFGIATGMLLPIVVFLQMGIDGFGMMAPFYIVLACLFTFVLQITRRGGSSNPLVSIAVTMFGLLYISWFFSFFINLKFMAHGEILILYLILVTKSNDIGAFFIGRSFGKHSLIPRISPKKTVEGTVGGIVTGCCVSLASKAYMSGFSWGQLCVLGVLLGVLGQVGDLAESLVKRDCGVKDSGRKLPGYGGMLDMLDSLFFTTPIFYFYMRVLVR
ncbi:MAG: phosphatidate cytidylyltransferase [Candidatus Omnitrophota bacterium]